MRGIDQVHLAYTGAAGRKSAFDFRRSKKGKSRGIVVFAHGYKGFKDWGAWNAVSLAFADAGYDFLKFNFSHAGATVDHPIDFPDTEAFAQNTYTKEIEDLNAIIDLCADPDGPGHPDLPIYLIGHSRGGGIGILTTAQDKRIRKLITWASVADFGQRFAFDIEKWRQEGITFVENSRTKQQLPHNFSFYSDYVENRELLDITAAAKRISVSWLIVHGTADESVSYFDADRLNAQCPEAELFFVRDAGHTFGAHHPWPHTELPEPLQIVVDKTIRFLEAR